MSELAMKALTMMKRDRLPMAEVARRCGVARNTVRDWYRKANYTKPTRAEMAESAIDRHNSERRQSVEEGIAAGRRCPACFLLLPHMDCPRKGSPRSR